MLGFGVANALNNAPPVVVNPPPVVINPPPQMNPAPPMNPGNPGPPMNPGNPMPPVNPGNPFQKKQYVYAQRTGQLKLGNDVIGTGYSGRGAANNPGMQNQRNVGPIPGGDFVMTRRADPGTGEPIIDLLPVAPSNAAGRFPFESFKIRCETNPPGGGGAGDIVLPRPAIDRIQINNADFSQLKVVP